MKIDNSLKSVGNAGNDGRTGSAGKAEGRKSPEAGVSVELSGQAAKMQALEAQISVVDVVDVAKVSEIKQAIADGRFRVNPDVIADRLLQTVQELIRAYKPQ